MMHPAQPFYRAPPPPPIVAPMSSATRWVFAVFVGLGVLGLVLGVVLWTIAIAASPESPDDALMGTGFAAFGVAVLLVYAQGITGMVWLYRAYSWLPWDQRWTRHWRGWIQPSQAALFLLVPYFQYYWMFVVNIGLCDALDRLRVAYPAEKPAPKNLAIAACVCQLVIPLPVGMILWLMYMARVEAITREMSARAAARGRFAF